MPCGDGVAVLKKFFVYEKYQGEPHHLGRQLYSHLLEFAKKNNIKTVMLDTPHNTVRAHKFYEKAGFCAALVGFRYKSAMIMPEIVHQVNKVKVINGISFFGF